MGRAAIDQLLYSLDRAFEGEESRWHGLVRNLTSLEPERWDDVPAGCVRSALAIVEHVGGALRVYDSQAFGDGSVHWDRPESVAAFPANGGSDAALGWLRDGHNQFREHVAALTDHQDLLAPRRSPHGPERQTRWVVTTMIEHELYHAGEINHVRLLFHGNDG